MNTMNKALTVAVGAGLAVALALMAWPHPPARTAAVPAAGAPVLMGARVQSIFDEDGGRRVYVALRLALRPEVPFSTITYRVRDESLIRDLRPGDEVRFAARREAGENTLVALERTRR